MAMLVWVLWLVLPLLLLYRLAKQHLWLILGSPNSTPNPFSSPARSA